MRYKGHNNVDLLVAGPHAFVVVATTVRAKCLVIVQKKKQPLPLYLHSKTSNRCILVAVVTLVAVALSLLEGLK